MKKIQDLGNKFKFIPGYVRLMLPVQNFLVIPSLRIPINFLKKHITKMLELTLVERAWKFCEILYVTKQFLQEF